jgi:hypothetical protein
VISDGRVAALPNMGEKTAQNILQQIQAIRKKKSDRRLPLGLALLVHRLGKIGTRTRRSQA